MSFKEKKYLLESINAFQNATLNITTDLAHCKFVQTFIGLSSEEINANKL